MKKINFNNKNFVLLKNTKSGTVNSDTVFKFMQKGNLVTADYHGSMVTYGKIIAYLEKDTLEMLYHCLTAENELKAGKAQAKISLTEDQKITLRLDWKWLTGDKSHGESIYSEV